MRFVVIVAATTAVALGGCSSSGVLLVRGVVRAQGAGDAEPIGGVTVQCRDGRDGAPRYARATTQDDGSYRLDHPYSGTWFPGLKPKGGDAYVELFAPGYERRLVKVRGGDEPGVVRGESGPYTRLDVTLVPAAAPDRSTRR